MAKGLIAELAPPHAQSVWGSRGEMVRATGLAVCCNYFSKKKKKKKNHKNQHTNLCIIGQNAFAATVIIKIYCYCSYMHKNF